MSAVQSVDTTVDIEIEPERSPEHDDEHGDEHSDEHGDDNNNNNKISIISSGALKHEVIPDKSVKSLTDDERAIIVANAKNGIDQPYFDVKYFSNGNYRIVKRKKVKPTVAQKVISAAANVVDPNPSKVYYTNDQLLLEHIIELNSKFDKLMNKHKKLKHKYQTLCTDLYVDDNSIDNSDNNNISANERSPEREADDNANSNNNISSNVPKLSTQPSKKIRWRDQVNFV